MVRIRGGFGCMPAVVAATAATETVQLPARSVVSLGYNYIGTGVPPGPNTEVVRSSLRPVVRPVSPHSVRMYDLRGRLVSRGKTVQLAAGTVTRAAYCVDNGIRRSLLLVR